MATYRGAVPADLPEKTIAASQGGADPGPSDTSPAVPADVIYKLLGFSFAMIVFPIGSYFFTLKTVFGGKSLLASMSVEPGGKNERHVPTPPAYNTGRG